MKTRSTESKTWCRMYFAGSAVLPSWAELSRVLIACNVLTRRGWRTAIMVLLCEVDVFEPLAVETHPPLHPATGKFLPILIRASTQLAPCSIIRRFTEDFLRRSKTCAPPVHRVCSTSPQHPFLRQNYDNAHFSPSECLIFIFGSAWYVPDSESLCSEFP
jgi:hypothetical protein